MDRSSGIHVTGKSRITMRRFRDSVDMFYLIFLIPAEQKGDVAKALLS
jgi:hypothetical protein